LNPRKTTCWDETSKKRNVLPGVTSDEEKGKWEQDVLLPEKSWKCYSSANSWTREVQGEVSDDDREVVSGMDYNNWKHKGVDDEGCHQEMKQQPLHSCHERRH